MAGLVQGPEPLTIRWHIVHTENRIPRRLPKYLARHLILGLVRFSVIIGRHLQTRLSRTEVGQKPQRVPHLPHADATARRGPKRSLFAQLLRLAAAWISEGA